MRWEAACERVLSSLESGGWNAAEVYVKEGRSRRYTLTQDIRSSGQSVEIGHAVRAGNARGSFFWAHSGRPQPALEWPAPGPGRLVLPGPQTGSRWKSSEEKTAPLATEGEATAFLTRLAKQLDAAFGGARLVSAVLEDGVSESEIASSRGVRCSTERRAAALHVEGVARTSQGAVIRRLYLAERALRRFDPDVVAGWLAERLILAGGVELESSRSAPTILAPEVGAVLLAGCLARLVGPDAAEKGREHRWGREPLTIVDDSRSERSLVAGPWDGEGVPTRRSVLVERGRYGRPLLAWWQTSIEEDASGCTQRPGWRDLPYPGPSQLSIEPAQGVSSEDLLASVSDGFYWREPLNRGVFDSAADRFSLPVAGYSIAAGRGRTPIRSAVVSGSITGLLESIDGFADDLRFSPMRGLLGSPSLRVSGLTAAPRS